MADQIDFIVADLDKFTQGEVIALALNVNANWTTEIVGLSQEEGRMLLAFLLEHVKRPEFQVRFRWNEGDVAFWDNRTALHCAIADYDTRRIMKRVALVGHPPRGPRMPD